MRHLRGTSSRRQSATLFLLAVASTVLSSAAHAVIPSVPISLATELLSETVPSAFAPVDFTARDYEIIWHGAPLEGVQFSIGHNSLEWVRVSNVLVLPRARLIVQATGYDSGQIRHAGFTQPLLGQEAKSVSADGKKVLQGASPIALISGESNSIDLVMQQGEKTIQGKLLIHFRPQGKPQQPMVFMDPSCSPYRPQVEIRGQQGSLSASLSAEPRSTAPLSELSSWAYIGCRMINTQGSQVRTSSLETYVFWDGVGDRIRINGIDTPSIGTSLWAMRLRSSREAVVLQTAKGSDVSLQQEIRFSYVIPEQVRYGFLGAGIGPYTYVLEAPGTDVHTLAPVLTLYASYFLTESNRIVAFNATAIHPEVYTDLGVYLHSESFQMLDQRVKVSIMLGAHTVGFVANDEMNFKFSAPQGFEIVLKDAFERGYNFIFGSFIYPDISGRSYYNLWSRWGSGGYFAELNYIAARETLRGERVYIRSAGISVGFPIMRFF